MYTAIAANKRNSLLIMALFVVIVGALGWIAANLYQSPSFLYLALIAGSVYALVQYFAAANLALSLSGAREVTKRDAPQLYRVVENISIATGQPIPRVYIIDDSAPNAFATGRDPNHSYVAVTSGLVEIMNDSELEAVVAHEMGHVKNYDIRLMMVVFGLVSAIGLIADLLMRVMWFGDDRRQNNTSPVFMVLGILAAILAPIVAVMVQLAISRQREYLADSTSALTTRYPQGLISALQKISHSGSALQRQNTATAHLFFANPLKGNTLSRLFSTHPPIEDRIARLKSMSDKL